MSEQSRDWLVPGASVAMVTHGRNGDRVAFSKVARIGKRDVVLDDGSRFNVNRLTRDDGSSWSAWTTRLMAADDPHVAETVEKIRRATRIAAARAACDDFAHHGSVRGTTLTAADVILALAPLTGIEAEIRALFESA